MVRYLEKQRIKANPDVSMITTAAVPSLQLSGCRFEDGAVIADFDSMLSMKSNRDEFDQKWLECLEGAAQDILNIIPPYLRVLSVNEMVCFACVSDTNSFGIAVEYPQIDIPDDLSIPMVSSNRPPIVSVFIAGLGIYPICAKLNHSCYPSCQFSLCSNQSGRQFRSQSGAPLSMKTLRCVPNNVELTDSYIDLYTDR